jgi:threonine/homoserine/homoserine lactone efflux protein
MVLTGFLKGLALGLLLSISVGPVIFTILRTSIAKGHVGGFAFIAGVSASDISVVLVCNLFSQLFQSAVTHEKIIGIGGSIFLLLLGIYNIFFKKSTVVIKETHIQERFHFREKAAIFASGFFMNTLNPGAFLFWFAASATILEDSQTKTHPIDYRLIVFVTTLAFVLASDIAKVLLANRIRTKLTPHNIHIINIISGIILVLFGVVLLYSILTGKVAGH